MNKYILVIQESHLHIGLFDDLKNRGEVQFCPVTRKKSNSKVLNCIMKIHCSWSINKHFKLPFRKYWYAYPKIQLENKHNTYVVIVDIALKAFSTGELNKLFAEVGVHGVLVLINSYDASSIGMLEIKDKIHKVNWSQILTFDPIEAEKYGWDYMGTCYYSMHHPQQIKENYPGINSSDAYFAGGIKGDREQLILEVFEKLVRENIVTSYNIMVSGKKRFERKKYEEKIHYYAGSWMPYEKILAGVLNTNVIIEILQKGQNGPSLRYYEAVCYNKKLLTNNPNVEKLPFYNPRYMKVFSGSDDIDFEWIKTKEEVNYGYDGSFSPYYLLSKMK